MYAPEFSPTEGMFDNDIFHMWKEVICMVKIYIYILTSESKCPPNANVSSKYGSTTIMFAMH